MFLTLFVNKKLDGYTFYAHNLGRFYSVFIIKYLISNNKINIAPIWKDNSILSLTLKFNKIKINKIIIINE